MIPEMTICNRSREGWNEECTAILQETKRLKRRYDLYRNEETWEAYRLARNQKSRTIKRTLCRMHRERVEKAAESPKSLWKVAKWARTRHNQLSAITPTLVDPSTGDAVDDSEGKARILRESFFPAPPEADLEDIARATYTDQINLPPITVQEVQNAIQGTSANKVPGPDGIPNLVLQAAMLTISPHLTRIFNQSIQLGYCPDHFRDSNTIALRKPGKDDYTTPKAYRPLALLNTIGKIMDAIIAKLLSYLIEKHQLLPGTHMRGRKLKSTEHALHTIIEKIYETWNEPPGKVASLLLLDVSGAFDNVSHARLLHNLRKRRIDEKTVLWITSFLQARHTHVIVDGHKSQPYKTGTGIPQGSPLSLALYLFYNADLIDICNQQNNTLATGYVDDVAILTWDTETKETCRRLEEAMELADQWASKHASVFDPKKFQVTHFTRANTRMDLDHVIDTRHGIMSPQRTCKYLGVIIDTKRQWEQHIETIEQKAIKTNTALSSLAGSTWGIGFKDLRKIYNGVAVPQMFYACLIWSNSSSPSYTYTNKTLNKLKSTQARAARIISGVFKAIASAALDIEVYLTPIKQQIWKHNAKMLATILSSEDALVRDWVIPQVNTGRGPTTYTSPLKAISQDLSRKQAIDRTEIETIIPYITPPWWLCPQTYIDNTEAATSRHQKETRKTSKNVHIYTDGSCINRKVGAAAVCLRTGHRKESYMGLETTSTVYAAELQGISLALSIADADTSINEKESKIIIYADNQAAIRTTANPTGKSGAYLLQEIVRQIDKLHAQGKTVELRWIPAYTGIHGNEKADEAAKEATGWREYGPVRPPAETRDGLRTLKSTMRTWIHKRV